MLTIAEIAKLAGVSKTTVSNVLNGKLEQVGKETREKILKIIEESGYTPHQAARALKSKRNRTIGLLFPHMPLRLVSNSFFFPGFLTGVAEACERFGYQLLVTTSFKNCDTDFHYERLLKTRSIDGLIVSDVFYNDPRFAILQKAHVPFVSIGKPEGAKIEGIYWVDHDQEHLAERATEYLVNLGHREIVFVGLSLQRVYTLQRLQGYKRTLEKAGIPFKEEFILCEEMWGTEAEERIASFLQGVSSFTAIFSVGGSLTLNCLRALEKMNLRVPQDVSLLGNLETENDRFLGINLSGIRVKPRTLGYVTAKTLIELAEGKEVERSQVLEAEFVEGASCSRVHDCAHKHVVREGGDNWL
jgi:DNA-binding LacI/PurR family transcriptional regulator